MLKYAIIKKEKIIFKIRKIKVARVCETDYYYI